MNISLNGREASKLLKLGPLCLGQSCGNRDFPTPPRCRQTGGSTAGLPPTTKIPFFSCQGEGKQENTTIPFNSPNETLFTYYFQRSKTGWGKDSLVFCTQLLVKLRLNTACSCPWKTRLSCTIHSVQLLPWNGIHIEMHPKKKDTDINRELGSWEGKCV